MSQADADHHEQQNNPKNDEVDDTSLQAVSLQDTYDQAVDYLRMAEASLSGSQTYPRNVQLLFQASRLYEAAIAGFKIVIENISNASDKTKLQFQFLELNVQQLHSLADFYYYTGDMPNNVKYHEQAAQAMEKCSEFAIQSGLVEGDSKQGIYWRGTISSLWADALEGKARIAEEAERWIEAAEYHELERDRKKQELDAYSRVERTGSTVRGSEARMLSAEQARLVCLARASMARGDSPAGLSYLKQASGVAEKAYQISPDWFPYRAIAESLRDELRNLLRVSSEHRVEMKYVDLEIKIGKCQQDGIYPIEARSSVAGESSGDFKLPMNSMELGRFLGILSTAIGRHQGVLRGATSERKELEYFGKKLYQALWEHPDIRSTHDRSVSIALADETSGLRLRLLIDDPILRSVPWEFLHDGEQFLVVSQRTPVVRHIRLTKPLKPTQVTPPLRMLVAVASPSDLPSLDVEAEWQQLSEAMASASLLVKIELLEHTSYASLQRALRTARAKGEGYHIIHYIGHGSYDNDSKRGYLALETLGGEEPDYFGGDTLGNLLRDHPSVRLVVLNGCQGAYGDPEQSFTSVAESLVRVGVPAVVAMQFPISDRAAIMFSDYFYSSLALGYPVDAALAESRKAIYAISDTVEFGTPILYLRSKEGVLFDMTGWADQQTK